jgi:hypothetical protein
MQLGILGTLEIDRDVDEWLRSAPLTVPYFGGTKLSFVLDGIVAGDPSPGDFAAAAASFLALNEEDRRAATRDVARHRNSFVGKGIRRWLHALTGKTDRLWESIRPTEIHVSRRDEDQMVYVCVLAECDWDVEHGIQLVYREGRILNRVSSQDGHLT